MATASPVIEKPRSQLMMMSLADVGWIADMEDSFRSQNHQITDILDKECSQNNTQDIKNELVNSQPNDAAMEKISALEGELERLKAQIAMLVQCPQSQAPMFQMPMTSTPCTPSAPLPPPPPPPPPPPVTPCNTPMKSVAQIIREVSNGSQLRLGELFYIVSLGIKEEEASSPSNIYFKVKKLRMWGLPAEYGGQ